MLTNLLYVSTTVTNIAVHFCNNYLRTDKHSWSCKCNSIFRCFSDEARALGFTVLVDMRGATWSTVKPILKALHENFPPGVVHQAIIIKPDNFWQKQRTSLGSHKYKFEVSTSPLVIDRNHIMYVCMYNILYLPTNFQLKYFYFSTSSGYTGNEFQLRCFK